MDLMKVFLSGLKSGVFALIATLITVVAGALAYATGYKPDGEIAGVVMTYVVVPVLAGLAGALNNWLKHKDDK